MISPSYKVNERELNLNFNYLFYQITEVFFQKKYKSLNLNENIATGSAMINGGVVTLLGMGIFQLVTTSSFLVTGAAIGGVVLGLTAIGGGGIYLAYRYLKREIRAKVEEGENIKNKFS